MFRKPKEESKETTPATPRVIWQGKVTDASTENPAYGRVFRVVLTDTHVLVEERGKPDALGNERWEDVTYGQGNFTSTYLLFKVMHGLLVIKDGVLERP